MQKFYIFLIVSCLSGLILTSCGLAEEDYPIDNVRIYKDPDYSQQASVFDENDTVYVKAWDWITEVTSATVIVKNVTKPGNEIEVELSNDESPVISEDPVIYFGKFTIYLGSTVDEDDKLRMHDKDKATIVADLNNDGHAATAQIVAMYIPPPPTNLKALAIPGGRVKLTWDASDPEDTVEEYCIYRSTSSEGAYVQVGTHPADGVSYEWTDEGLEIGETYYYKVLARDGDDDESEFSNKASARTKRALLICKFESQVVRPGSSLKVHLYVGRENSNVAIRVFNLTGEIVMQDQLLLSPEEEGIWTWNGENMYGEKVNNGTYILFIEADASYGGKVTEKKVVGVLF